MDTRLNNSGFRTPTEERIYLQVKEAPNTEVCTLSTHELGEQRASLSCRLPLLQAVWASLNTGRGPQGWLAGLLWNDLSSCREANHGWGAGHTHSAAIRGTTSPDAETEHQGTCSLPASVRLAGQRNPRGSLCCSLGAAGTVPPPSRSPADAGTPTSNMPCFKRLLEYLLT